MNLTARYTVGVVRLVLSLWLIGNALSNAFANASKPALMTVDASVKAHSNTLVWRRYTVDDGLPQNSVTAIAEDVQGFLWLATFGGLVRYDGSSFERFGLSEGFASERFTSLLSDQRARLWIGTEDSGLYWWSEGQVRRAAFCKQRCGIWQIAQDDLRRVFVASSEGLFMLNAGSDPARTESWQSLAPFDRRAANSVAIKDDVIAVARGENLWQATLATLKFTQHPDPLKPGYLLHLQSSEAGLHALAGDALWQLVEGKLKQKLRLSSKKRVNQLISRQGKPLLSYSPGGLLELADDNTTEQVVVDHPDWPQTVISTIYADRNGDIWVGSNGGGLFRSRPRYVQALGGSDAPLQRPVMSVTQDAQHGLLVGMMCGGVQRFADLRWTTILANDGTHGCVFNVLADTPNDAAASANAPLTLHVAANATSVLKLTHSLDRTTPQVSSKLALTDRLELNALPKQNSNEVISMRALFRDVSGQLWAGGQAGLYLFEENRFVRYASSPSAVINAMGELTDGRMWLATSDGVFVSSEGSVRQFSQLAGPPMPAARAVLELGVDDLLIGTYGAGLFRVRGSVVTHFDTGAGLHENFSSCLLRDQNDLIWSSGNRGLSVIPLAQLDRLANARTEVAAAAVGQTQDSAELNPILLNQQDGMRASETNGGTQGACARLHDGRFAFATIDGVALVEPTEILAAPSAGLPIYVAIGSSREWLVNPPTINLAADTGFIDVRFSTPDLRSGPMLRFQHRLISTELVQPWKASSSSRTVQLNALPFGESSFEVQLSDVSGIRQTASVRFFRAKPWYLQPLTISAATASLLLLSGLLVYRRINALKRSAAHLERTVQARTTELTLALAEVEHLAMTDSLTGLANHRALLQALDTMQLETVELDNARLGVTANPDDAPAQNKLLPGSFSGPLSELSQENSQHWALAILDVDQFKHYNDHFGHPEGDALLQRVAGWLRALPAEIAMQSHTAQLRCIARQGGDEFALLFSGVSIAELKSALSGLCCAAQQSAIAHSPSARHASVSLSVGAIYLNAPSSVEAALKRADQALYKVKQQGGNAAIVDRCI